MQVVNLLVVWLLTTHVFSFNENNAEKNVNDPLAVAMSKNDSCLLSPSQPENHNSIVFPAHQPRVITVGPDNGDIRGNTSEAIQTAVDALRHCGGGTVKILPGTFEVIAPVRLFSNVVLTGSGKETVLKKSKGFRTRFTVDAGYGELQLTVEDASGFAVGMGVQIFDSKKRYAWDVTTAVITGIKGNVIYIDNYLIRDYRADEGGVISNACSIISAVEAKNVTVSDLVIDGSRETNDDLNGCRGGGIYLHKVQGALIENLSVTNFNADGISWQITEDVVVRNCEVSFCANAGLHPGSGTLYTLIEGNNCHDNDYDGLFVCWRVRHGIVRNNRLNRNGRFGICTGHMDTDMLYESNEISGNGQDGVNFRKETAANAPHRNIFRNNTVENNGFKNGGYGFSFNSPAEDVILEGNTIRNTKGGQQKAAILIDRYGVPVVLKNNKVEGHVNGQVVTNNNK